MWRLLAGLGGLGLACFLLILFGNARYHSGELAERIEWTKRQDAATLAATQAKSAKERQQDAITNEHTRTLESDLAAARASAAAYADSLRRASRGSPSGNLPVAPDTTAPAAGAGQASELDDAIACADNTVKAEGWQSWWSAISPAP